MERAGQRGYRGVVDGRGAPASLRRARAPPRVLAGHLRDGGELTRRRVIESGYGLTGGEVGLRVRRFPRFRYGGEMTGGVGHSRQQWGLDKGAGSEALTGDGCQGGQSSGGVAVPSSSQCSCARRRVRVVGGCCICGESKREADGWRSSPAWCARWRRSRGETDSGVGRGGEMIEWPFPARAARR
jgi:hypothetical protein